MAYSTTPQFSTYQTKTVTFDDVQNFRDGLVQRDISIVNMYYDLVRKDQSDVTVVLQKRPGIVNTSYLLSKVASSDPIRGSFYDPTSKTLFWAVKDKVYKLTPPSTTPSSVQTLTTTTGEVGFCSYIKSDNTRYVFFSDGISLYGYNFETSVKVVDADLPSPHNPHIAYIDGYLVLIETNTGDLFNSDVDDPFSWTPGDWIAAESYTDHLKRVVRMKNYLVLFGESSIEFFYDAGVVSGSPFQRNDSLVKNIGYLGGFTQVGDVIFFFGQELNRAIAVYVLSGYEVKQISTPVIDRALQKNYPNGLSSINLANNGFIVSVNGISFYAINTTESTWLYDYLHNRWYEWKNKNNESLGIEAAWQLVNGECLVALKGKEAICSLDQTVGKDFDGIFTCTYITKKLNFDTYNTKFMSKVIVFCDKPQKQGTSYLNLSWSDNDYQTYTYPRKINIISQLPVARQLGKFRERAFKLEYKDKYPLRLHRLEVFYNTGAH